LPEQMVVGMLTNVLLKCFVFCFPERSIHQ
jgi:hypothetical protein